MVIREFAGVKLTAEQRDRADERRVESDDAVRCSSRAFGGQGCQGAESGRAKLLNLNTLITLFAVAVCSLSCASQEGSFTSRKIVELDAGRTLEVLEDEIDGEWCTLRYVSVVDLGDPRGVKRHAESVLTLYAAPWAEKSSCSKIHLEAVEFLEHEHWRTRAMEFYASRDDEGRWEIN